MKTKYKILFACIITCIATAFATVYIMEHDITSFLYSSEKIMCKNNAAPDENGCCPDETYTYMPDYDGSYCCPNNGGDCFPPIKK